jgi:hypothetical protein
LQKAQIRYAANRHSKKRQLGRIEGGSLDYLRPNMSRNVAPMRVVSLIIAFAIAGPAPFGARTFEPLR